MPRQLRVLLEGVAAHIVQRGADGCVCFRSENDRILYLLHLRDLSLKHRARVHAYCLMTNHVHLLLSPSSNEGCQVMMKQLGHRYAQYFNRTYGRTGPLWGGRYYSCIAESALYVLACYRYIELNPVRAGLAASPADYKWSSYAANALGAEDALLAPHDEFSALGIDEVSRRAAYKNLFDGTFEPALLEHIRTSTVGGYPLASDGFKAEMAARFGTRLARSRPGPRSGKARDSVPDTDLF